jgi:hypothetical protein
VETGSGVALDGLFDERGYLKKFKTQKKGAPAAARGTGVKPLPASAPPHVLAPADAAKAPPAPVPAAKVRMLEGSCPKCRAPFAFRLVALPDKPWLDIPCKTCGGKFRLKLDGIK